MKLYYAPQTRATRARWLLEELEVPYELERVNLSAGEQKSPAYRKIHPLGRVPALVDSDLKLFESAAICAYLADKFPEKKLAPAVGTPERGLYYQWLVYVMATAEPPLVDVFLHTVRLPVEERSAAIAEQGRREWGEAAGVLERSLEGKSFLVGDRFTAADVMIGSLVGWARALRLLDGLPTLEAYSKRLTERPAYKRATAD